MHSGFFVHPPPILYLQDREFISKFVFIGIANSTPPESKKVLFMRLYLWACFHQKRYLTQKDPGLWMRKAKNERKRLFKKVVLNPITSRNTYFDLVHVYHFYKIDSERFQKKVCVYQNLILFFFSIFDCFFPRHQQHRSCHTKHTQTKKIPLEQEHTSLATDSYISVVIEYNKEWTEIKCFRG